MVSITLSVCGRDSEGGFSCHPCPGMSDASKEVCGVLSEARCRSIVWVRADRVDKEERGTGVCHFPRTFKGEATTEMK